MESLEIFSYKDLLEFERNGMHNIAINIIRNELRNPELFCYYKPGNTKTPLTKTESKEKFIKYMEDNYPFLAGKEQSFIENLTVADFRNLEAISNHTTYLDYPSIIIDKDYKPFETLPKEFSDEARKNLPNFIDRLNKINQ